ncbi:MAG: YHS domain-containing protein [Planctomycetales bacterium]
MSTLFKIFLPWSFFVGLGIAIWFSRAQSSPGQVHIDPVCRMEVADSWGFEADHHGQAYYFCTAECRKRFVAAPQKFLGERCAVCKELTDPATAVPATYLGRTWWLCCDEHRQQFKAEPAAFFMHTMWGIPTWMYYLSIATVLVVSFGVLERRGKTEVSPTDATAAIDQRGARFPELVQLNPSSAVPPSPPPARKSAPRPAARIDLLGSRFVQFLAKSRRVRFAAQAVIVALFFLVIAAGLFGNQNPALNIAPILTWTIWWGGLVILIMFAGKAWCWVCPWDAVAGWMEKLRFWNKAEQGLSLNLKWPRPLRNVLLATGLFVGLTWIELGFGVTMRPSITACLAIAMLVMAIVSAFLFEKKGFCRYACLVGRVSGLYAMFSGVEVRSRDQSVCRSCAGKECVHGSQTAYGCPTFLFPGYLTSNTYCIQCLECVQACPEDNLAINLRPWGADLIAQHRPRTDEAYLALLMLSITGFHGLTMTPNWLRLTDWLASSLSLGNLLAFSLGMTLLMLLPIAVYAALVWLSFRIGAAATGPERLSYHDYFVRYAYALLPIALFYHLAHNMEHLLMEGPKVLAMISDPFGWDWNLFGTASWKIPPLVSLDVLWIVQVALVLIGHVYSLWIAHHTSHQLFADRIAARRSQFPMLLAMIAFSIFSLWLLKQPMEMRTSAM